MKRSAARLLARALLCLLAAAFAGCGGAAQKGAQGEPDTDTLAREINTFTDELLKKVESAPDPSVGLDEAQRLLDERRAALSARIRQVREGKQFRESRDAQGRLLECEVNNTDRVLRLRTLHLERWMRDAEFKSKLDKLTGDYQDLFK